MHDQQIVALYWDRDEAAISATAEKYGSYCTAIAQNILANREDAEECVNDTYLRAWNAIPPHRPAVLSAFLGKITRNLSFNRYRHDHAEKRGGGELPLVLEELADCVAGGDCVEAALEQQALTRAIDGFLAALPARKRDIFVCRYWYTDPIAAIAARYGMTESAVAMALNRMRHTLRHYLKERGF